MFLFCLVFSLCFKVLREHDKLTRWMRALTEHLAVATVDLLDAQKQLSRSDGQTLRAENAMSAGSSERTIDIQGDALLNNGDIHQETPDCSQEDGLPTVDDLVKDNRIQRCRCGFNLWLFLENIHYLYIDVARNTKNLNIYINAISN